MKTTRLITCCTLCPAFSRSVHDGITHFLCSLGSAEAGYSTEASARNHPPADCPLRKGPVVLRVMG